MTVCDTTAVVEEVDEEQWQRRFELVDATFDALTFRPGTKIALSGISVTVTETVPCVRTGEPVEMCWDDQDQGETLFAAIADPTVDDTELRDRTLRAALRAAVNNDLHELCEWFTVDGIQVYDPHPNGGRYEALPFDAEVLIAGDDHRPARSPYLHTGGVLELPAARVRTVAAELCERVHVGGPTNGRFSVHGDHLSHHATYPDRDSGEPRTWSWSREWLGEYAVTDVGNPSAALRSSLVADMFTLAAESAVHEVAEWLRCDGARVWDPHPRTHAQHDLVTLRTVHHSTPWIPRQAAGDAGEVTDL